MKKRMRYICCLMLAASLTAGLLAGCGNDTAGTKDKSTTEDKAQTKEKEQDSQEKTGEGEQEDAVKLNPDKPLSITIWHYYNGAQQVAFDELVNEFNETVGKEKGIFVKGYSQGNVNELEDAVMASMNEEVGSEEMPNIFSAYADAAYTVDKRGKLADISAYMSEEELDSYVDSYIEEGRIGKGNTLRIFPTAKSSEIFMMNKTDWDKFAEASGASLDDLTTLEGVTETAQKYYEWTDSLTPDVPEDGKAFYGRDSVANLFVIGSKQFGQDIFRVEDGKASVSADRETMKRIWDNFYVPFVKGYFTAYGKFRSDEVKIGEILAFTGSSTASMYFPDEVEQEDSAYPIDYVVLPAPSFAEGENYIVQQGAGMVVTETTKEEEYASVLFLKWFTESENNIRFSCASGYLPVKKEANSLGAVDKVVKEQGLEIPDKTYDVLDSLFGTLETAVPYTTKAFEHGTEARKVLEYNLADKAAEDRAAVQELIAQGQTLEEACASYISEESFQNWYNDFVAALQNTMNKAE